MLMTAEDQSFTALNPAYNRTFKPNCLSVGLVVPIEAYPQTLAPTLERHLERVQTAERLGFAAVWLRDVPFNVPSFGDAGQTLDPFVYLGYLAARTDRIGLGVASAILPLRHPAHVAKAAASVDQLSGGRLLLGVASGDRPEEYPAMALPADERAERFRDAFDYIRAVAADYPAFANSFGALTGGADLLPKPVAGRLPLLVTGGSRQDPSWVAAQADGWMTYPRPLPNQAATVADWRARLRAVDAPDKPIMQPLYVDLTEDDDAPPAPIHLGLRCGPRTLHAHLSALQAIGLNHVALNLRFNSADVDATLERLAATLRPDFMIEETA